MHLLTFAKYNLIIPKFGFYIQNIGKEQLKLK